MRTSDCLRYLRWWAPVTQRFSYCKCNITMRCAFQQWQNSKHQHVNI